MLYDGEKDEEVTYRLVTPEESDPQQGLISTTSPVGKSLMGKEEGDEVVVRTPAGARNFEIRRLTTIHDQVGNIDNKLLDARTDPNRLPQVNCTTQCGRLKSAAKTCKQQIFGIMH